MEFRGEQIRVLRRSYQRSINISVKSDGDVLLTAGRSVPQRQILRFLHEAWPWVLKSIKKFEEFRKDHPPKSYRQGESFLFLGKGRSLNFVEGYGKRWRIIAGDDKLLIHVPTVYWRQRNWNEPQPQIKALIMRFYELQARTILHARIQKYSAIMNVTPSRLSFRCQKTRWGSCSPTGGISLNWRLVAAPLEVIDYVVVHELAHLAEPNHSKSFWRLVGLTLPDYERAKKWLKQHHFELDFISSGGR